GQTPQGFQRRQAVHVELPKLLDDRMLGWSEERKLQLAPARLLAFAGDLGPPFAIKVLGFELHQNLLGPLVDVPWDASQPGNVNAVALVGRAGDDFVEEDDLVF